MLTGKIKKHYFYRVMLMVGLLIVPFSLQAATVTANLKSLMQVKKVRGGAHEVPFVQYLSLDVSGLSREMSFNVDFRAEPEAFRDEERFDLYQAVFHIAPSAALQIEGGRQWISDGFETSLMDGLKLGITPEDWKVGFGIYGGLPRHTDLGDFSGINEELVGGMSVFLRDVKDTTGQLSFRYHRFDLNTTNLRENDTITAALALSHQFSDWWSSPMIYSNFEYNIPGKTIDAGTFGCDIYPHWRVALNFEGGYYDVDRLMTQASLFGQAITDEMLQGSQGAEIKLGKGFRFFEDFSYQRYNVPGRGNSNGYLGGAGLGYYWKKAKLSTTGQFYYGNSFGGKVYGGLIELVNKSFDKLHIDASFDISKYTKITNQNDIAISAVGGVGYELTKNSSLLLGGEYNHNNWFNNEGRVTLQFQLGINSAQSRMSNRGTKIMRRQNAS